MGGQTEHALWGSNVKAGKKPKVETLKEVI